MGDGGGGGGGGAAAVSGMKSWLALAGQSWQ